MIGGLIGMRVTWSTAEVGAGFTIQLPVTGDDFIVGKANRRRRWIVAATVVLLAIAGIGAWTGWRSKQFRDLADRVNVGMTEAEVIAILGPPDASWNSFPPCRIMAYGKGTKLRHAANNFRLDVTGRAQLHEGKAAWPVQVNLDEHD